MDTKQTMRIYHIHRFTVIILLLFVSTVDGQECQSTYYLEGGTTHHHVCIFTQPATIYLAKSQCDLIGGRLDWTNSSPEEINIFPRNLLTVSSIDNFWLRQEGAVCKLAKLVNGVWEIRQPLCTRERPYVCNCGIVSPCAARTTTTTPTSTTTKTTVKTSATTTTPSPTTTKATKTTTKGTTIQGATTTKGTTIQGVTTTTGTTTTTTGTNSTATTPQYLANTALELDFKLSSVGMIAVYVTGALLLIMLILVIIATMVGVVYACQKRSSRGNTSKRYRKSEDREADYTNPVYEQTLPDESMNSIVPAPSNNYANDPTGTGDNQPQEFNY